MITWVLLAATILVALAYSRWRQSYWSSRGVPTPPGALPFMGHTLKLFSRKPPRWEVFNEIYRKHGGSTFCGLYDMMKPSLIVGDPELVKFVLIKNFDHFADRRTAELTNSKDKVFQEMLTAATGSHWKGIRSVLSTSFSSGRMKAMFPLLEAKANALLEFLHKQLEKDPVVLMKRSYSLYSMEVIMSCAFGVETDSFTEEDTVFVKKARELFSLSTFMVLKFLIFMASPKLAKLLNLRMSHENTEYFTEIVMEMLKQRTEGTKRGDFLDIMMETRSEQTEGADKMKPKYHLSDETIIASSILFIVAGFDNTANTMALVTFLLSKNPKEQERLREEMRNALAENGTLTYQAVMESKFLDACVSETLRIYPPAGETERKCTKACGLPGTDLVIPEGMMVSVPIFSIHHDERYWPDPKKFDPTRFMPENKDNLISGAYLPFGLGPRNCIAMRFALMEVKLAIAKIVLEFDLQCAPGHEEIEFDDFVMRPKQIHTILTPIAKN